MNRKPEWTSATEMARPPIPFVRSEAEQKVNKVLHVEAGGSFGGSLRILETYLGYADKRHAIVAEDHYRSLLLKEVNSQTEWLDLGCGREILRDWLPNGKADQVMLSERARRFVGIDRIADAVSRNPYVREKVVGDFFHLPLADNSLHLVTAQMVVEHVERPLELLREVKRVLRPGGRFIFLTPNFLNYQVFAASFFPDGLKKQIVRYLEYRDESDVFKTHYRMNTRNKILTTARAAGLTVDGIHMAHSAWEFRRIPPLFWIEKVISRVLDLDRMSNFRSCIIAILTKPTLDS